MILCCYANFKQLNSHRSRRSLIWDFSESDDDDSDVGGYGMPWFFPWFMMANEFDSEDEDD